MTAILSFLAALSAASTSHAVAADPECTYDPETELARDAVSFDQTEGQGWRPLYDAGCYIEAAGLLRDWRALHEGEFERSDPRQASLARILLWHEGQMWAFAQDNETALPLMQQAYQEEDTIHDRAWNRYVDGTLAFLRRDREALDTATAELAAVPQPPGWASAVGQDGKPISLPWPQNLDVLQGLARCWDETYATAYVCRNIPAVR